MPGAITRPGAMSITVGAGMHHGLGHRSQARSRVRPPGRIRRIPHEARHRSEAVAPHEYRPNEGRPWCERGNRDPSPERGGFRGLTTAGRPTWLLSDASSPWGFSAAKISNHFSSRFAGIRPTFRPAGPPEFYGRQRAVSAEGRAELIDSSARVYEASEPRLFVVGDERTPRSYHHA